VQLYTDGFCRGNPGPGGWAAILVYEGTEREFYGSEKQTTNSRMELRAVIEGLRRLKQPCRVSVECDSRYVVSAFNERWLEEWQANGWRRTNGRPVLNQDLWRQLLDEHAKHDVHRWTWARGHDGSAHTERCRRLALDGSRHASKP